MHTGVLMATKSRSVMSRIVRIARRSVVVALFGLVVTSAGLPAQAFAAQHSTHILLPMDGQGDPPEMP